MASIWTKTQDLPPRGSLPGDLTADVAVIGGGMAGLLTAWFLRRRGRRPIVLEAGRLAGGQTCGTTAKITSQHGLCYASLIEKHGLEKARLYAQANQKAITLYSHLVRELNADCGFTECPAFLYTSRDPLSLEREQAAAARLGLPAQMTGETELPFPVQAALRFDGQARFHPLAFLSALVKDLTVYEQTRVLSVENDHICTERGTVTAKQIVFAVHYPFVLIPGWYFLRMHQERSYVLALENAQPLHGMYYGIDKPDGLSLRAAGAYLLLGGGGHRTGNNRPGGQYAALRQAAQAWWPHSRVVAQWSAQDCMPLDGIPYIGRFSPSAPNWYVATGFQKWGMTSSMVAAQLLTDLICGVENPWQAVFSPQRFTPLASSRQFFADGFQAVKGLSKTLLFHPDAELDALPPGHGGLLNYQGKKVGGYRDEDGTVYLVTPKCPHMGCQLEWNPEERTWDCPCHGSRFDFRGKLLDGPAQTDLPRR